MGLRRLSTGEVGVPGSGDTVNAGGQKLRHNFIEAFSAFSDQRLLGEIKNPLTGEEWAEAHSCGYYQVHEPGYYQNTLSTGTLHNIDTSEHTLTTLNLYLPQIIDNYTGKDPNYNYARRGDKIKIIDTANSWNTFPITINAFSGQLINGSSSYTSSESMSELILTVAQINSVDQWVVDRNSLTISSSDTPVFNVTKILDPVDDTVIPIASKFSYNVIKLILYFSEYSAATSSTVNRSSCEVFAMINGNEIITVTSNVNETAKISDFGLEIIDNLVCFVGSPLSSNRCTVNISILNSLTAIEPYKFPVKSNLLVRYGSGGWVKDQFALQWASKQYISNQLTVDWETN